MSGPTGKEVQELREEIGGNLFNLNDNIRALSGSVNSVKNALLNVEGGLKDLNESNNIHSKKMWWLTFFIVLIGIVNLSLLTMKAWEIFPW